MKITTRIMVSYLAIYFAALIMVNCVSKQAPKVEMKVGEAYEDGSRSDALTFGLGTDGGYVLKNSQNYRIPEMAAVLPKITRISEIKSPKQSADENPSISVFYDGTHKLNTIQIECKLYTNPKDCVHQSGCGWCGQLTRCIKGTQIGPLEPCVRSTYIFTSPPEWAGKTESIEMGSVIANVSTQ